MRVAVVGLGYVGLVSAAGFARLGHEVRGLDTDSRRLGALRAGHLPFHEPGLAEDVARGRATGQLTFHDDPASALQDVETVLVAVGTLGSDGGWQSRAITACLESIAPALPDGATLVIRSTLPPDALERQASVVRSARQAAGAVGPIAVVLNPEFTREGTAIADFHAPDRIVIGSIDDPTGAGVEAVRRLYAGIDAPVLVMSGRDACLAKLASNLFLATKISFANELSRICDRYGARIDAVVESMAFDPRIGGSFLRPGVGFGGSCLPHQVAATVRSFVDDGDTLPLLAAVETVNHGQRDRFVGLLEQLTGGLRGRRIALLGLTFKPGTDDLRDAPSVPIARELLARGAVVVAYDPMPAARACAADLVHGIQVVASAREAIRDADAVGLVTEWPEFREIDWVDAASATHAPIMVDGRNALDPARMLHAGFTYAGMGRGLQMPEPQLDTAAAEPQPAPRVAAPRKVAAASASRTHIEEPAPWAADEALQPAMQELPR